MSKTFAKGPWYEPLPSSILFWKWFILVMYWVDKDSDFIARLGDHGIWPGLWFGECNFSYGGMTCAHTVGCQKYKQHGSMRTHMGWGFVSGVCYNSPGQIKSLLT